MGVGMLVEFVFFYLDFVVFNMFENFWKVVNDGIVDFFMWEYFIFKKYYDNGEIRCVGEIYIFWLSWKIVVFIKLVKGIVLDGRVDDLLEKLNKGIWYFNENLEEVVEYISMNLDYLEEDVREWFKIVKFLERI